MYMGMRRGGLIIYIYNYYNPARGERYEEIPSSIQRLQRLSDPGLSLRLHLARPSHQQHNTQVRVNLEAAAAGSGGGGSNELYSLFRLPYIFYLRNIFRFRFRLYIILYIE